jgi:hypothetical protein
MAMRSTYTPKRSTRKAATPKRTVTPKKKAPPKYSHGPAKGIPRKFVSGPAPAGGLKKR